MASSKNPKYLLYLLIFKQVTENQNVNLTLAEKLTVDLLPSHQWACFKTLSFSYQSSKPESTAVLGEKWTRLCDLSLTEWRSEDH